MKKSLSLVLMSLGGLFLAAVLAGGVLLALGKPPRERLTAAVKALKGQVPEPPPAAVVAPVETSASLPQDISLLKDARDRLAEDQERFLQEKGMAHAQLEAERVEVERLKAEVSQRLEEARRPAASASAAGGAPATGPAAAVSAKGVKALAEIVAKMTPKAASQLFLKENEESVAGVLQRMDPKQAAKVLAEMVSADPERAQRVAAILREGKKS